MLNKITLQNSIEDALQEYTEAVGDILDQVGSADENNPVSIKDITNILKQAAQKSSQAIADAVDEYIKSATITLDTGTLITPLPGLVSPVGPVTGVITLAAPTTLMNAIK